MQSTFSGTRLKCECCLQSAIDVFSSHLSKSHQLLADEKSKGLLKSMQKTMEVMRQEMKRHQQFRADYARDLVDLVKVRELNVGPTQKKLQTVPYLMGHEKRDREEQTEEKKKKGKKRRKQK